MKISKIIYNNSPTFIQNILASIKGYMINRTRYNHNFHKELHRYENNYYKPKKLLRELLESCKNTVYYKELFAEYNFNTDAEDIFRELKKLPVLKRETIINNHSGFINSNFKGKTFMIGTSGTTGTSLVFPSSYERDNKQWAVWWRYRRKLGLDLNTLCGHFGSQVIVPINNKKPPFWRNNYFGEQILFSSFHLSLETIVYYHEKINSKELTWLHGHAHNISLLSSLIIEKKLIPIESVRVVTTGADSLFIRHRKIISQAFPNAIIRQHYGMSEAVCNISEDINGELKIDQDYGYVEFIPVDVNNPSLCKIVATGFNNHPFPLIRYDTGDLATVEKTKEGDFKILQIDGRSTECLLLPDGRRISATAITNFEYTENVREVQFYQQDVYNIVMRVVKREGYSITDEKEVLRLLRERIPSNVDIFIEYVDEIERTKTGKIKYIISDIK